LPVRKRKYENYRNFSNEAKIEKDCDRTGRAQRKQNLFVKAVGVTKKLWERNTARKTAHLLWEDNIIEREYSETLHYYEDSRMVAKN